MYVPCPEKQKKTDEEFAKDFAFWHKLREDSFVSSIFEGVLKTTTTCLSCRNKNTGFEIFNMLSLPIPEKETVKFKVLYVPFELSGEPILLQVSIESDGSADELVQMVSESLELGGSSQFFLCIVTNREVIEIVSGKTNPKELIEKTKEPSKFLVIYEDCKPSKKQSKMEIENESLLLCFFDILVSEDEASFQTVSGFPRVAFFSEKDGPTLSDLQSKVLEMRASFSKKLNEAEMTNHLGKISRVTKPKIQNSEENSFFISKNERNSVGMEIENNEDNESSAQKSQVHEGEPKREMIDETKSREEELSSDFGSAKNEEGTQKKNLRKKQVASIFQTEKAKGNQETSRRKESERKTIAMDEEFQKKNKQQAKPNSKETSQNKALAESALGSNWKLTFLKENGEESFVPSTKESLKAFFGFTSIPDGHNGFGLHLKLWTYLTDFPVSHLSRVLETEQAEVCDGSGPSYSMADCLQLFFQEEKLTAENQVYCPVCKIHRPCLRKLDLWTAPKVLIVHFKRFKMTEKFGGKSKKISSRIKFGSSLDLARYFPTRSVDANKNSSFNLYAIINHFGTLESGHYKAACLNFQDQKWYEFDDTKISPAFPEMVSRHTASGYILFYACN